MEDLDMIEDRKLVTLPRKPSVAAVLDAYLKSKAAKTGEDVSFVDGLRILFDRYHPPFPSSTSSLEPL